MAHVAWIAGGAVPALRYTREKVHGEIEPVQDLGSPAGLGSTTAIAVDGEGRVYLFYAAHGLAPADGAVPGTRIWLRRSDGGGAFGDPIAIDHEKNGVSERSAIAAHVDEQTGTVYVLYSGSFLKDERPLRDVLLMSSEDRGETFKTTMVERRKLKNDPCSSASLFQEFITTVAVWEYSGFVSFAMVRRRNDRIDAPMGPRAEQRNIRRSHPAMAAGGNELIMAWLERPSEPAVAGLVPRRADAGRERHGPGAAGPRESRGPRAR
jgi:hypothetical protein